jgi:hypothetical protein
MAAFGALQHQGVLTELIAQFVDLKSGGHAPDCYGSDAFESIQLRRPAYTV